MTEVPNRSAAEQNELEEQALKNVGAFVFWFSQAELGLRHVLADALDLPFELYDAVTASYDFRTLCDVTFAVWRFRLAGDPTALVAIEKLISRCKEMNDTRVRIVHGTWRPSSAGLSARHMSRQKLTVSELFNDPTELQLAGEKCRRLAGEVFSFINPPAKWRRRT
jgi:hypothetical protein